MKHFFSYTLSCLMATTVFGIDNKPAREVFDAAVTAYNKNDFTTAYKMFNNLYVLKSDEPLVNFYLGRCATEIKLYDEALLAFERVLTIDPAHARSRIEMARVYMEEDSLDNAEVELKTTQEYKLPDNVKSQVDILLKIIADSRKKHHASAILIGGAGIDTNVKNASLYLPPGATGSNAKPAYDYYISETAVVNHVYDIDKQYKWQNSFIAFGQQYRQVVDSNVLYMQLSSGINYTTASYQLTITPSIEKLKYGLTHDGSYNGGITGFAGSLISRLSLMDRMQDMMVGYGLSEKINTSLANSIVMEQTLGVKRQYFTTDGMDAIVLDSSLGFKKPLQDGKSAAVTLMLSKNIAIAGTGTRNIATNYYSKGFKLDYSMPVLGYEVGANSVFKLQGYQDNTRSDFQKSFGVSATKPYGKDMMIGVTFNRIWNGSTSIDNTSQQPYQKTTLSVTISKAFQ